MCPKTLFLLQSSKEENARLKEKLEEEGFKVVGTSEDGTGAVDEILACAPDVLLCSLVLTGSDGISAIERVKAGNANVKIIVYSCLMREEIISAALAAGASYFIHKPCELSVLIERISLINGESAVDAQAQIVPAKKQGPTIDERISRIFINVGIPPHIKGYAFLREGVKMAVSDPSIINNVTKKLYPMIGERYATTASKVERAIRHAIEVAWNRGRIDNINSILGVRAYMGAEKPTNSEFIALVADKMILERA